MVKDKTPLNSDRCFLTNNRHPWDLELAEYVSEIEENRDGRLGCKEDEELLVSNLAHHRISLTEAQVQDAYLHRIHLFRFRIIPDGNCLFRSVSQALFGTQELHMHVRELCIEHLSQNIVEFLPFFEPPSPDEDLLDFAFSQVTKLRENSVWGGFESLMALSDMYNIEFHVILGGAVKNSSVTIHKYYYNRGQCHEMTDVVDAAGEPSGACAAPSSSPSGLPMKKVFLIWLSCGHYDLASDTPEDPVETEQWLREANEAHALEQEARAKARRRKSSSASSKRRSRCEPGGDGAMGEMPILTAALLAEANAVLGEGPAPAVDPATMSAEDLTLQLLNHPIEAEPEPDPASESESQSPSRERGNDEDVRDLS